MSNAAKLRRLALVYSVATLIAWAIGAPHPVVIMLMAAAGTSIRAAQSEGGDNG